MGGVGNGGGGSGKRDSVPGTPDSARRTSSSKVLEMAGKFESRSAVVVSAGKGGGGSGGGLPKLGDGEEDAGASGGGGLPAPEYVE